MKERDEGGDGAVPPPISAANENLLACLRTIASVIESGVRKLYGHNITDIRTAFASLENGDGVIDRFELDLV